MSYDRYDADEMRHFCSALFKKLGVPAEEADITAEILVYADLRGIDSHGLAHTRRYIRAIQAGDYAVRREIAIVHETLATALVDGGNGLGYPVGVRAMQIAIEKARQVGCACVAVRRSHHFGAAGYYAEMALAHDMIGIVVTNAGPAVVPTFGSRGQVGTNPIALAIPTNKEPPFVLDMATSVKATGKIEILVREGRQAPPGWFIREDGSTGGDPVDFFEALVQRRVGGLLPLGGAGEEGSGYKGFGLALGIELLAPVLAGDTASPFMRYEKGQPEPTVAHFVQAIRIDVFRPVAEFKAEADRLLAHIKASPKAPGHDRIFIAGEKEYECMLERGRHGLPLHPKIVEDLQKLADELGVKMPEPKHGS